MPTKFKPSVVIAEKQSNGTIKKRNQHFYMKNTSTKDIVEMYEKSNTLPKIKDKLKKELFRRGVLDASI